MKIEEIEDYVILVEIRALKHEPTVTYDEFLKNVGWKRITNKNQSKSNASITNHCK